MRNKNKDQLSSIRKEIDRLDCQLVKILKERQDLVNRASSLKNDEHAVRDFDRVEEVIKRIRAKKNKVPILLLTARDNIDDKVKGLDYGADDYLVKPFIFEELMARIRVLLRRNSGNADNVVTIANLKVDLDAKTVFRDDILIKLSAREYSVLEYLIRNKGKILSRERIEDHIWNYDYEGGTNVIDVYIRYLRKKIDDSYTPKLIHTIRGLGYVLRVDNENE